MLQGIFILLSKYQPLPQTNVLTIVSLYKWLEAEVCLKYISMSISACSSSSLPREIYGSFHVGCFENGGLLGAILADGRMNMEPIAPSSPQTLPPSATSAPPGSSVLTGVPPFCETENLRAILHRFLHLQPSGISPCNKPQILLYFSLAVRIPAPDLALTWIA